MSSRLEFRVRAFFAKLRGLLSRETQQDEFNDEVQEHLQMLTERFAAQGMSSEDAARAARLQFGNTTLLKEDRRELQSLTGVEALWLDFRHFDAHTIKEPSLCNRLNCYARVGDRCCNRDFLAYSYTLEDFISERMYAGPKFGFVVMCVVGCMGLILVTIGVYSVLAYATARKTHEIGIRIALGAKGADVLGFDRRNGTAFRRGGHFNRDHD